MKTKMYLGKSVKYNVIKAVDEGIFDVVIELVDKSLVYSLVWHSVWDGLNVSLLSPIFDPIENNLWKEN
jgi:hypothetical protein